MEENCFIMLCWFLLYNNANKPLLYIYLLPLEPPSPLPIPPLQVIKEHQTRLPVLYSNFSPAIYLTHGSLYVQRRQWHPTPVHLLGKSHVWRSLVGCSPWGRTESDTTEATESSSSSSLYTLMLLSPFFPFSLSPTVSTSPFSLSVSPFLLCK